MHTLSEIRTLNVSNRAASVFRLRNPVMDIRISNYSESKQFASVSRSSYGGDCEFYWLLRHSVCFTRSVPKITLFIGWSLFAPLYTIQNHFLIASIAEAHKKSLYKFLWSRTAPCVCCMITKTGSLHQLAYSVSCSWFLAVVCYRRMEFDNQ